MHPEAAIHNNLDSKELGLETGDGAASALHGGVAEFRHLTPVDDKLATVIAAWATLPAKARKEILAIVAAVS